MMSLESSRRELQFEYTYSILNFWGVKSGGFGPGLSWTSVRYRPRLGQKVLWGWFQGDDVPNIPTNHPLESSCLS